MARRGPGRAGPIEAFDRVSNPLDTPILLAYPLDTDIRPENDWRSGGPGEVPDGTVGAHLGNRLQCVTDSTRFRRASRAWS